MYTIINAEKTAIINEDTNDDTSTTSYECELCEVLFSVKERLTQKYSSLKDPIEQINHELFNFIDRNRGLYSSNINPRQIYYFIVENKAITHRMLYEEFEGEIAPNTCLKFLKKFVKLKKFLKVYCFNENLLPELPVSDSKSGWSYDMHTMLVYVHSSVEVDYEVGKDGYDRLTSSKNIEHIVKYYIQKTIAGIEKHKRKERKKAEAELSKIKDKEQVKEKAVKYRKQRLAKKHVKKRKRYDELVQESQELGKELLVLIKEVRAFGVTGFIDISLENIDTLDIPVDLKNRCKIHVEEVVKVREEIKNLEEKLGIDKEQNRDV